MSIEGQGHFFTIYFLGFLYVLCFTRLGHQESVYRTIGPLFFMLCLILFLSLQMDISEDRVSSDDVIAERPTPLQ